MGDDGIEAELKQILESSALQEAAAGEDKDPADTRVITLLNSHSLFSKFGKEVLDVHYVTTPIETRDGAISLFLEWLAKQKGVSQTADPPAPENAEALQARGAFRVTGWFSAPPSSHPCRPRHTATHHTPTTPPSHPRRTPTTPHTTPQPHHTPTNPPPHRHTTTDCQACQS